MFAAAMPKTVKTVAVLDRAAELVQAGGTLYREVLASLMKEDRIAGVRVAGGRYSYLGWELQPRDVMAIY
jgi:pyruvate-ferredoxin/flavodoxin oxidoreductase